tara:strand:- start:954 stop:2195 length:1242 start_codon:yes stop_codon:yes gene_type:complete
MHKPNHNDEDFFDVMARPEGVGPKNFEASPPTLGERLVKWLPSKQKDPAKKERGERNLKNFVDFVIPQSKLDVGLTLAAGPVGRVARIKKLKPVRRSGDWDIFDIDNLKKQANEMPEIATHGRHANIYNEKDIKIIDSVVPKGTDSYGNSITKHSYMVKPINEFSSDKTKALSTLSFNLTAKTTNSGKPYKLITDIELASPQSNELMSRAAEAKRRIKQANPMNNIDIVQEEKAFKDYTRQAKISKINSGKLLSNILSRVESDWAIKNNNNSLDALYTMATSFLRRASKAEFYLDDAIRPLNESNNLGRFSPLAIKLNKARQAGDDIEPVIDEIARELTGFFEESGKVQGFQKLGVGNKLFKGQVTGEGVYKSGKVEYPPFYLKSFKEKLAGVMGLSMVQLDQYLEKDLSEQK